MNKRTYTKWLSLLVCIALTFTILPSIYAEGLNGPGQSNESNESRNTDQLYQRKNPNPDQPPGQVTIVENGQADTVIVIAQDATAKEQQIAEEIQNYLFQISEAEIPVTSAVYDQYQTKIFVGKAAPDYAASQAAILEDGSNPDAFRLLAYDKTIQLVGAGDNGTVYAGYDLLEQLGVRWIMPGDIGTVIPKTNTVVLEEQDTIQHPAFELRMQKPDGYQILPSQIPLVYDRLEVKPWQDHSRLLDWNIGSQLWPCGITRTQRPDLFLKDKNGNATGHLDVSIPEVLNCIVDGSIAKLQKDPGMKFLSMSPVDGVPEVLDPDPEWDAEDFDALNGVNSTTDRYIKFINQVLDRLTAAGYPDVKIVLFAYSSYMKPPVREIPNPRIVPIIAPITIERSHAMGNDLSWERNYLKELIEDWAALGVQPMMYDYRFNLADPGLPFSMMNQAASELKFYYETGLIGSKAEVLPAWGYHGPSLYLDAKLKWNPYLDVDALMDDYFEKFFGPAAQPMQEHFDILENAFAKADYFAGSIYDFPHILTKKVVEDMEKTLSKAEKEAAKASDPVYAQRVNITRIAFDFGDNFLKMMDELNNFEFANAKQHLDNILELRYEAISHSPVALSPWASYLYTNWFWKDIVEDGYNRTQNGGRIVAELPDEWHAMLFPNNHGHELGLWKKELGTESWMKLKTYSETWSDQGLRYYKGNVWYRTTVDLKKQYDDGRPVHLWMSNVDESARVWVNGIELPVVKKGASLMKPWVFDATGAVEFGKPNVVVVDTTNLLLDELGTGGIMGPVMFYQPAN